MKTTPDSVPCRLCDRPFRRDELTRHHALPRPRGGGVEHVELICAVCQGMVHATFTNRTLEASYHTIELLRTAPELAPYLKWIRKQPASRRTRNKQRKRKT